MALPAIMTGLLFPLLIQAIKWLSPVAREALEAGLRSFYQAALNSESSWDDVAAKILCTLLSVDVSDIVSTSSGPGTMPTDVVDTLTKGVIEIATGNPMGWTADRPFDPSLDGGGG